MRHPYRTVSLVVVTLVLLTGCSTSHTFQLLLTVKNAETGESVPGAKVVLDAGTLSGDRKGDMEAGHHALGSTNEDGQFSYDVFISPYPSDVPHWFLKLQKDGFEPLVIDIKPASQPRKRDGEKVPLPVVVEMKPLPKKP
jgi:hypothetical protein